MLNYRFFIKIILLRCLCSYNMYIIIVEMIIKETKNIFCTTFEIFMSVEN